MNFLEIKKLLRHRYPLFLIDGVNQIESMSMCNAFKNLTYNEWFFPAHFPELPIMPGSLQIEAYTQAAALPLLLDNDSLLGLNIPLILVGIEHVRFLKPVYPGSRLDITVKVDKIAMGLIISSVTGMVENSEVSTCQILYRFNKESL